MPPKTTTIQEPLNPLSTPAIDTKLTALRADNAQAVKDLSAAFDPERWARIIQQAETQGLRVADIESLCGKMRRTRQEWHPRNPAAALEAAKIGLLLALGSSPTDADIQAFESAAAQAL